MSETSMRFIEPSQPNNRVVAVEISGRLAAEDMEALVGRLQPIVDRGEKALLYVDMVNYEGSVKVPGTALPTYEDQGSSLAA